MSWYERVVYSLLIFLRRRGRGATHKQVARETRAYFGLLRRWAVWVNATLCYTVGRTQGAIVSDDSCVGHELETAVAEVAKKFGLRIDQLERRLGLR
jgi:hypothetical protein